MNFGRMVQIVSETASSEDETRVKEAINDAYMYFAEVAEIPNNTTPIAITSAYELYDLPDELIRLGYVILTKTGETDPTFLSPKQEDETDKEGYYKRGKKIGFGTLTGTAKVHYFGYPSQLVEDSDIPNAQIPSRIHIGICQLAAADLIEEASALSNDVDKLQNASSLRNLAEKKRYELERLNKNYDTTPASIRQVF